MNLARGAVPRRLGLAAVAAGLFLGALAWVALRTGPVRGALRCYSALIASANAGDLRAARDLCTERYRDADPLRLADEGGIVGLPRNVHPNFQAWRVGPHVWLCPTNRAGPIYQFARERGAWRFDGPVGVLAPGGRVIRSVAPSLAGVVGATEDTP